MRAPRPPRRLVGSVMAWACASWAGPLCLVLLLLGVACTDGTGRRDDVTQSGVSSQRGQQLVEHYQCLRCHSRAVERTSDNCVVCHNAIQAAAELGRLELVADSTPDLDLGAYVRAWNSRIVHFRELPSFVGVTRHLRNEWLEEFLMRPHDLRPRLGETMPNLGIERQEARDIIAFLSDLDRGVTSSRKFFHDETIADFRQVHPQLEAGDSTRGSAVYAAKQCDSCHAFGSAVPLRGVVVDDERESRALELAPDLRFTRERFRPLALVPWLLDPAFYKHDTAMPRTELTYQEARDLAAFIVDAPLRPSDSRAPPTRLPLLTRPVHYLEVQEEVFGKICIHCHSDPDAELGDGGPGFAGGFGFRPRGLDLSDYESTFAGYLDDDGKRRSVFEADGDGTPRLVAALWARWREQTEGTAGEVRGMPLALPALDPRQIQLVESWIAQGRPR